MSWISVYVHFVWATKNREPLLKDGIRNSVFSHIRENARIKGIQIDHINGWVDHVHCLVSLGSDQTLENVMKLIKGESSYWINQNHLTKTKFRWQEEYFAVSVSESNVESVRRYIANQENHHRKIGFAEEFEEFLSRGGFRRFKG